MGRIVALDVGDVRIGVAASDPLGIIAQPREVITRTQLDADLQAVLRVLKEYEADRLVVGIPLDQNGQPGPQAAKIREFMDQLSPLTPVEIVTEDERFSTAAATRMLIAADVRRKDRKKVVDKVAAHHILQTHLDRIAREKNRPV
jgi:putative Holliday junction resolvase